MSAIRKLNSKKGLSNQILQMGSNQMNMQDDAYSRYEDGHQRGAGDRVHVLQEAPIQQV